MKRTTNYLARKVWIKANGPIPKDSEGFSYEIHHKDNNPSNNDLVNLEMLTIREHLERHLEQEDWFAAALIAKRLGLGAGYSSDLQKGKKRPGVGGVPKGTIPWNKGGCHSEETKQKLSEIRKGNVYRPLKFADYVKNDILAFYQTKPQVDLAVGERGKNGKIITYERAFAKRYAELYDMSPNHLHNIITGKLKCFK